jgi:hypothetical protein
MTTPPIEHVGDPRHPDHESFVLEVGRAKLADAALGRILVDLLRVHCGVDYWPLTRLSHGPLREELEKHVGKLPGLDSAVTVFADAITARNAFIHATPVLHGLEYRPKDRSSVDFFEVEDVEKVTARLIAAAGLGNKLLYHDGGRAVRDYVDAEA